jgi:hypothetical protein
MLCVVLTFSDYTSATTTVALTQQAMNTTKQRKLLSKLRSAVSASTHSSSISLSL